MGPTLFVNCQLDVFVEIYSPVMTGPLYSTDLPVLYEFISVVLKLQYNEEILKATKAFLSSPFMKALVFFSQKATHSLYEEVGEQQFFTLNLVTVVNSSQVSLSSLHLLFYCILKDFQKHPLDFLSLSGPIFSVE